MNVITRRWLREFSRAHADARASLDGWYRVARRAGWRSLVDVCRDFPAADAVRVGSNRTATVFNIRGNRYRLITAIHYDRQRVFALSFLTHAEYDKDTWKDTL